MSLHRTLMNGWWNKIKPTGATSELKVDRFPSIYANVETIPTRYVQQSNQLSLVSNNNYLKEKGFGSQFQMPKDEVERVKKASVPHGTPDETLDGAGPKGDEPLVPTSGGKPPPNVAETMAVKHEPFQDVEGVPDYYERLRNPPFDNSTTNVLDETGRVKDALSDPALISHVDKLYEELNTGVRISKNKGGRGAGGGRGVETTFNGKKLEDLTPADGEALKSALTKLKRADDDATGKVARRIHADYRKLDGAFRGLLATASVGGFLTEQTKSMTKDGKAVLKEAVEEAKADLLAHPPEHGPPPRAKKAHRKTGKEIAIELSEVVADEAIATNDLFESALAELRKIKASKEAKREAKVALEQAKAEAEGEGDESGSDVEGDGHELEGEGGSEGAETHGTEPKGIRAPRSAKASKVKLADLSKAFFTGKNLELSIVPIAEQLGLEVAVPTTGGKTARSKYRTALIARILAVKVAKQAEGAVGGGGAK